MLSLPFSQFSQLSPMEMSIVNNVKTFLPIILFSIVLPFIDIVTDLRLIIRLSTYEDEYNNPPRKSEA